MAGYLAYEYLSKGTIYGEKWDPDGGEEEWKKAEPSEDREEEAEPNKGDYRRYVEVSSLLKGDGAHLPGVVNPSELSRFLQMWTYVELCHWITFFFIYFVGKK